MASELRVLFDRQGDGEGWKVRLVPGTGGGAPAAVPLGVALSEKDYENLRWYLEEYLDLPDYGSRVRAGRIENNLRRWGHSPLTPPAHRRRTSRIRTSQSALST